MELWTNQFKSQQNNRISCSITKNKFYFCLHLILFILSHIKYCFQVSFLFFILNIISIMQIVGGGNNFIKNCVSVITGIN